MASPLIIDLDSIGKNGGEIQELIDRTPFKGSSMDEIRHGIDGTWSLISRGARQEDLTSPLEIMGFDELSVELILDISRTRKRTRGKYEDGEQLCFTSEGLRWATPGTAADHCARRMGREQVMDVTCGQGGQVLALSKTCDSVIGIDIEPLNCLMSIMNCLELEKTNVQVINGDCLDPEVIDLAGSGCAIFSDPARPPGAIERRMEEIIPDPRKVKEAYERVAGGMCFELPPYISLDKIGMDSEAEYISLDGRVNRLNIYTGDLKRCERSAVILPHGDTITGSPAPKEQGVVSGPFIFEVDPSVVKAGLEK